MGSFFYIKKENLSHHTTRIQLSRDCPTNPLKTANVLLCLQSHHVSQMGMPVPPWHSWTTARKPQEKPQKYCWVHQQH